MVVDDAAQGVTDVVRGADLIDSTARQIHLQRLLGLPQPRYLHLPVAASAAGGNFPNRPARGRSMQLSPAPRSRGARLLGHRPPAQLWDAAPRELLSWAMLNWEIAKLPRERSIAYPAA